MLSTAVDVLTQLFCISVICIHYKLFIYGIAFLRKITILARVLGRPSHQIIYLYILTTETGKKSSS
jgi:hypothetical protein